MRRGAHAHMRKGRDPLVVWGTVFYLLRAASHGACCCLLRAKHIALLQRENSRERLSS